MMLLDESGTKAQEVAATIMKSINSVGLEATIVSLAQEKLPKKRLTALKSDLANKEVITFNLVEKVGKYKKPTYKVLIDLKNNEVEVNVITAEVKLEFYKYEAK